MAQHGEPVEEQSVCPAVFRVCLTMNADSHFVDPHFPTTQWSHVILAQGEHSRAHQALDHLCRKYWRPIYAFARHRGLSPHDAEDVTQAYFRHLLKRGYIHEADPQRGRFRAFLIHDLKYFLSNQRARARALKRGGGVVIIPMDTAFVEARLGPLDPARAEADEWFDRQWALEVVRQAQSRVAQDYAALEKGKLFTVLQGGLVTPPDAAQYALWQEELGMSPGALKVALHRLRARFREAMQQLVRETVATEDDVKAEMDHLRRALSRSQPPG